MRAVEDRVASRLRHARLPEACNHCVGRGARVTARAPTVLLAPPVPCTLAGAPLAELLGGFKSTGQGRRSNHRREKKSRQGEKKSHVHVHVQRALSARHTTTRSEAATRDRRKSHRVHEQGTTRARASSRRHPQRNIAGGGRRARPGPKVCVAASSAFSVLRPHRLGHCAPHLLLPPPPLSPRSLAPVALPPASHWAAACLADVGGSSARAHARDLRQGL